MTKKRELIERWNEPAWGERLRKICDFSVDFRYNGIEHSSDEMLDLLEGLPFRDEVPGGGDLRGAPMLSSFAGRAYSFSNWDFSYSHCVVNFIQCDLTSAKFVDSRLESNFSGTLSGADFSGAKMRGSSILSSAVQNCRFDHADLTNVSFDGSDLTGSSFVSAKARGAAFTRTTIVKCNFQSAILDRAWFQQVTLDRTTDLRGASLVNIHDEEQRDTFGRRVLRSTNWRAATYDATTKTGTDPAAVDIEIIDKALKVLKRIKRPEAATLEARFQEVRDRMKRDTILDWIAEIEKHSSAQELTLLKEVYEQALIVLK